ncbi:hypothetical protein KP509_25G047500 [Ceratopteris richardii]|nr:hypothetical protein KP509_25G047500 [Ceratopteris richardii]
MIGCALLDMYARCGSLDEARNLFDNLSSKDVVSWGAMIAGYVQHKSGLSALKLFKEMQEKGIEPTNITFLSVIKACSTIGAIIEGNLIHDSILRLQYESDLAIGNALIDMYAKCGVLDSAQNIFLRLPTHNIVSYSTLLDAFVQHGRSFAALCLFGKMQLKNITSCTVTYLGVLKACCNIAALEPGMILHHDIVVNNAEVDITVANTVIDMYAKCGLLDEARRVFDMLPMRSTVSWSIMSNGYVQTGENHMTLELYDEMQNEQVTPDNVTYVAVLKACGNANLIAKGKAVHKQMVDSGITLDTMLGSTLIDMYTKCGDLNEAEQVFDCVPNKDVVLWSALICGYVHDGKYAQALGLFKKMQQSSVNPDRVVFLCAIRACRCLGALSEGERIHCLARTHGFESDLIVVSALIDMYGKCGSMKSACELFARLSHRDAVAWGAIIAGYAHNGDYDMVKKYTEEMKSQCQMPIGHALSHVLSAVTLSGSIDEGHNLLKAGIMDGMVGPNIDHYNCVIDMLGRAGNLRDAEHMLQSKPFPANLVDWTALLTACSSHGNSMLGRECYQQISYLDPSASFGHSLLCKLYVEMG